MPILKTWRLKSLICYGYGVHAYNSSTQKAKSGVILEFKAILGYIPVGGREGVGVGEGGRDTD